MKPAPSNFTDLRRGHRVEREDQRIFSEHGDEIGTEGAGSRSEVDLADDGQVSSIAEAIRVAGHADVTSDSGGRLGLHVDEAPTDINQSSRW